MTWLFFALLAMIMFSLYEVLSRVAGVTAKNPRLFSSLYNGLGAVLALGLLWLEPSPNIHLSINQMFLTLAGMVFWILFGRLEYFAHKQTEASTMAVLLKLGPVVTFLLSGLFLNEAVTETKLIGLILILFASYLILMREIRQLKFDRGSILSLLVAVILGVAWTFDKVVSPWFGIGLFTSMSFGAPAVVNALIPPFSRAEIAKELRGLDWKLVVLSLLTVVGYGSMMKALSMGEASRVIPIATSTTPLVVLMSALFLKENNNLKIKLLATLLTVGGIVCLR